MIIDRQMSFHEDMIGRALLALPEKVKSAIRNVVFVVDEVEEGELLGHYHGIPNTKRGANYFGVLPDRITLYQRTIEREAKETGRPVEEVVRLTVWHEIGHYLGFDEPGVRKLERKWRRQFSSHEAVNKERNK